jgi:hypothetical protein
MLYDETSAANWRALVSTRGAILPLLDAFGEPLDHEKIGDLALAHARKDSGAVQDLLVAAETRGRAGSSIAAATVIARRYNDGSLTIEDQLATLDEAIGLAPGSFHRRQSRDPPPTSQPASPASWSPSRYRAASPRQGSRPP